MNAEKILEKLSAKGISLSLTADDNISVVAEADIVDEITIDFIKKNKSILVQHLKLIRSISFDNMDDAEYSPLLPLLHSNICRASYSQESLWYVCRLEGEKSLYNIYWSLRLIGKLNVDALKKSIKEIVRRHRVLRIYFEETSDGIFQVVPENMEETDIEFFDLSKFGDSESEKEKELESLRRTHIKHHFDLSKAPLVCFRIVKYSYDQYLLQSIFHHSIFDAWSVNIYARELEFFYKSYVDDSASFLPEPKTQYMDYACWQRERVKSGMLKQQKEYWKNKLKNLPSVLELPTDYSRPPVQSYRGRQFRFDFSKETTRRLRAASEEFQTTLYVILLAAFKVLLYRYSGQSDVTVGISVANRNHPDVVDIIGFVSNVLALRSHFDIRDCFLDVIKKVKETAYEGYANAQVPFEEVVNLLNPQRSLNHSPLFQVMFVLLKSDDKKLQLPGLKVEEIDEDVETSPYDITIIMFESQRGLSGKIGYSTDLFKATTIERMIANFEMLLNGALTKPNTRIKLLPILTKKEEEKILLGWDRTVASFSR